MTETIPTTKRLSGIPPGRCTNHRIRRMLPTKIEDVPDFLFGLVRPGEHLGEEEQLDPCLKVESMDFQHLVPTHQLVLRHSFIVRACVYLMACAGEFAHGSDANEILVLDPDKSVALR
jgi:hypothetical protein